MGGLISLVPHRGVLQVASWSWESRKHEPWQGVLVRRRRSERGRSLAFGSGSLELKVSRAALPVGAHILELLDSVVLRGTPAEAGALTPQEPSNPRFWASGLQACKGFELRIPRLAASAWGLSRCQGPTFLLTWLQHHRLKIHLELVMAVVYVCMYGNIYTYIYICITSKCAGRSKCMLDFKGSFLPAWPGLLKGVQLPGCGMRVLIWLRNLFLWC